MKPNPAEGCRARGSETDDPFRPDSEVDLVVVRRGVFDSPVAGATGNREAFVLLEKS